MGRGSPNADGSVLLARSSALGGFASLVETIAAGFTTRA